MKIFGQLLFPIDRNYMNPNYIKDFLKSNIIIQRMFKHPEIFHQCLYILMKLILEIPDQRILRLIELVIQLIFDENIEFIVNKSTIKVKKKKINEKSSQFNDHIISSILIVYLSSNSVNFLVN
jgi:hypothetical protein